MAFCMKIFICPNHPTMSIRIFQITFVIFGNLFKGSSKHSEHGTWNLPHSFLNLIFANPRPIYLSSSTNGVALSCISWYMLMILSSAETIIYLFNISFMRYSKKFPLKILACYTTFLVQKLLTQLLVYFYINMLMSKIYSPSLKRMELNLFPHHLALLSLSLSLLIRLLLTLPCIINWWAPSNIFLSFDQIFPIRSTNSLNTCMHQLNSIGKP